MVKLTSARELRLYGPWPARNRWEYINAGLYVFAAILMVCGFVCEIWGWSGRLGLVVLMLSLVLITLVNCHDLVAHMAGIDYRVFLMGFDLQLGFVEFAVPVVQGVGCVVLFLGVLFIFIEAERKRGYSKLGQHALNMLVAGPILWVVGSIHNACQTYERADGHIQILQQSVYIPFLMGSLLLAVGAIINNVEHNTSIHHGMRLLGKSWIVLGIIGSLLFLIGGLMNLVKVFKMQQMDGIRLEKLRNGAQERLIRGREGQVPLILEEERRRKKQMGEAKVAPAPVAVPNPAPGSTPYKDVLVGDV